MNKNSSKTETLSSSVSPPKKKTSSQLKSYRTGKTGNTNSDSGDSVPQVNAADQNTHSPRTASEQKNRELLPLYRAVLIGKPNVGKSSLFNKLTKTNSAIITNQSGTTRDGINRIMKWGDSAMLITDLPGWDEGYTGENTPKTGDSELYHKVYNRGVINQSVVEYLKAQLAESDIIVMVFDVKDFTTEDEAVLQIVKKHVQKVKNKPVVYCANKCDQAKDDWLTADIYELGIDELIPVSSLNVRGFDSLRNKIFSFETKLVAEGVSPCNPHVFLPRTDYKLALVGRPNAGKSSLFNALLGKTRSVVSVIEGTTRDIVEDYLNIGKYSVKLIDTGGMRKKSKKKGVVEQFSLQKAIHAINQSDVVVLLVDTMAKLGDQDKKILSLAISKKKSAVVAFTKWDLVKEKWENYDKDLLLTYPPISQYSRIPISAHNRKNLIKLLKLVDDLYTSRAKKISPAALNRALKIAAEQRNLGGGGYGLVRIHYAMQVQNHPPVFYLYVNNLNQVKNNFRLYIRNQIEELMDLQGTPLTIKFFERKHSNPVSAGGVGSDSKSGEGEKSRKVIKTGKTIRAKHSQKPVRSSGRTHKRKPRT